MNNFTFHSPTKIIFGRGTHKNVGAEIKNYTDGKVLLHYGMNSIKKSGLYGEITASLKEAGVEFVELGGVQPNPRVSLVREGVKLCREQDVKFILAVGGGSVIDSSKAIAIGVNYGGDVWDFFQDKAKKPEGVLPVGTVLTIPAAGSESSANAVITNEETQMKIGYGSEKIRPQFSILNPELCFTLPKSQLAAGVSDIMAHIMERYFTHTQNTEVTDGLCESVYKTVVHNAPKAYKNMNDYNAWAEIMWAGTIAHNSLLGRGREEDWGSHGVEHPLSAVYDIAHGAGLAVVFPAWIKYVYKENIGMFVQFANRMWGVEHSLRAPESVIADGIEKMEEFFKSIGLPTRLGDLGIDDKDFKLMAQKAVAGRTLGNFKKLTAEDVENIYKLSL